MWLVYTAWRHKLQCNTVAAAAVVAAAAAEAAAAAGESWEC